MRLCGDKRSGRAKVLLLGLGLVPAALLVTGCGNERGDGDHLSRDLLIYSSTTYVPVRSTTTTSTTTTTAAPPVTPAPTAAPTTALKLPPPPPPTAAPGPTPAVQRATERTAGLETVLGDVEHAIGEIDEGIGDVEDQG